MVVVAIAGILAAIALPSYQQHLMRSRSSDAQKELSIITQLQERYRSTNPSYAQTLAYIGYAPPGNSHYDDFALAPLPLSNPPSFVAGYQASDTPTNGDAQARDTACSSLTNTLLAGQLIYGDNNAASNPACWPK